MTAERQQDSINATGQQTGNGTCTATGKQIGNMTADSQQDSRQAGNGTWKATRSKTADSQTASPAVHAPS